MSWKLTGLATIVFWALIGAAPAAADDRRGGEVGVLIGAITADEAMVGDDPAVDLTFGLRGGSVFGRRWGWFVDGLYADIGTSNGLGNARTVVGRTGIDVLFNPERDARWLITAGAGWIVVDYEDAVYNDFHNPIASLGFGQRIRLGANTRLRWELRADRTLDDARLGDDAVQGHALLGFSWGPAGEPPSPPDTDEDGVRDGRDRCPDSPDGAAVGPDGCAPDDDGDGVPNNLDACPRSQAGPLLGPDGCPADSDGDGVADFTDVCADTPSAAEVDEWGCPKDLDADSIYDGLDACPGTPRGARIDARGCASDRDGDGVADGLDRCPETPADASVDARGCEPDRDGDGVPDGADACPDTPAETRVVDARGCPHEVPLFEEGRSELVLTGVRFETGSDVLASESRGTLDRVARSLLDYPDVRVEIGGHTDSVGEAGLNLDLSRRRAESVRNYLVRQGVGEDRLRVRGFGETRPLDDNTTRAGRERNRRVELRRIEAGTGS